jgi:hypothetical protein
MTTTLPTTDTAGPDPATLQRYRRLTVRTCLALLTATGLALGLWAALWPQAFYDSFPGFGRQWVALDGPYNEHLVRDFGNLNLALAVVTAIAAITLGRQVVLAAGLAYLVYAVPHLAYHLHHLGELETVDVVGNVVSLGLSVLLPVVVLVLGANGLDPERPNATT